MSRIKGNLEGDLAQRVLAKLGSLAFIPEGDAALFGIFDRSTRTSQFLTHGAIKPSNTLRLGSITKLALGYLAVKYGVPLNDTVYTHLKALHPETYPSSDTITFRDLMSHTSGIVTYTELPNATQLAEFYTPAVIVDLAWKNKKLMFPPSSAWFYSNTNSEVVALWLESVTNMKFRQLVETNLQQSGGCASLSVDDGNIRDYPMTTSGYREFNMPYSYPSCSGTLLATAEDCMKMVDYMANDKKHWETMKQFATSVPRYPDPDNPAGGRQYGLFLQEFELSSGILAYGHDGHIGVSSFVCETPGFVFFVHASLEMTTAKWMEYVNSILEEVIES